MVHMKSCNHDWLRFFMLIILEFGNRILAEIRVPPFRNSTLFSIEMFLWYMNFELVDRVRRAGLNREVCAEGAVRICVQTVVHVVQPTEKGNWKNLSQFLLLCFQQVSHKYFILTILKGYKVK